MANPDAAAREAITIVGVLGILILASLFRWAYKRGKGGKGDGEGKDKNRGKDDGGGKDKNRGKDDDGKKNRNKDREKSDINRDKKKDGKDGDKGNQQPNTPASTDFDPNKKSDGDSGEGGAAGALNQIPGKESIKWNFKPNDDVTFGFEHDGPVKFTYHPEQPEANTPGTSFIPPPAPGPGGNGGWFGGGPPGGPTSPIGGIMRNPQTATIPNIRTQPPFDPVYLATSRPPGEFNYSEQLAQPWLTQPITPNPVPLYAPFREPVLVSTSPLSSNSVVSPITPDGPININTAIIPEHIDPFTWSSAQPAKSYFTAADLHQDPLDLKLDGEKEKEKIEVGLDLKPRRLSEVLGVPGLGELLGPAAGDRYNPTLFGELNQNRQPQNVKVSPTRAKGPPISPIDLESRVHYETEEAKTLSPLKPGFDNPTGEKAKQKERTRQGKRWDEVNGVYVSPTSIDLPTPLAGETKEAEKIRREINAENREKAKAKTSKERTKIPISPTKAGGRERVKKMKKKKVKVLDPETKQIQTEEVLVTDSERDEIEEKVSPTKARRKVRVAVSDSLSDGEDLYERERLRAKEKLRRKLKLEAEAEYVDVDEDGRKVKKKEKTKISLSDEAAEERVRAKRKARAREEELYDSGEDELAKNRRKAKARREKIRNSREKVDIDDEEEDIYERVPDGRGGTRLRRLPQRSRRKISAGEEYEEEYEMGDVRQGGQGRLRRRVQQPMQPMYQDEMAMPVPLQHVPSGQQQQQYMQHQQQQQPQQQSMQPEPILAQTRRIDRGVIDDEIRREQPNLTRAEREQLAESRIRRIEADQVEVAPKVRKPVDNTTADVEKVKVENIKQPREQKPVEIESQEAEEKPDVRTRVRPGHDERRVLGRDPRTRIGDEEDRIEPVNEVVEEEEEVKPAEEITMNRTERVDKPKEQEKVRNDPLPVRVKPNGPNPLQRQRRQFSASSPPEEPEEVRKEEIKEDGGESLVKPVSHDEVSEHSTEPITMRTSFVEERVAGDPVDVKPGGGETHTSLYHDVRPEHTVKPGRIPVVGHTVKPESDVRPDTTTVRPKTTVTPESRPVEPDSAVEPERIIKPVQTTRQEQTVESERPVKPKGTVKPERTTQPEKSVESDVEEERSPGGSPRNNFQRDTEQVRKPVRTEREHHPMGHNARNDQEEENSNCPRPVDRAGDQRAENHMDRSPIRRKPKRRPREIDPASPDQSMEASDRSPRRENEQLRGHDSREKTDENPREQYSPREAEQQMLRKSINRRLHKKTRLNEKDRHELSGIILDKWIDDRNSLLDKMPDESEKSVLKGLVDSWGDKPPSAWRGKTRHHVIDRENDFEQQEVEREGEKEDERQIRSRNPERRRKPKAITELGEQQRAKPPTQDAIFSRNDIQTQSNRQRRRQPLNLMDAEDVDTNREIEDVSHLNDEQIAEYEKTGKLPFDEYVENESSKVSRDRNEKIPLGHASHQDQDEERATRSGKDNSFKPEGWEDDPYELRSTQADTRTNAQSDIKSNRDKPIQLNQSRKKSYDSAYGSDEDRQEDKLTLRPEPTHFNIDPKISQSESRETDLFEHTESVEPTSYKPKDQNGPSRNYDFDPKIHTITSEKEEPPRARMDLLDKDPIEDFRNEMLRQNQQPIQVHTALVETPEAELFHPRRDQNDLEARNPDLANMGRRGRQGITQGGHQHRENIDNPERIGRPEQRENVQNGQRETRGRSPEATSRRDSKDEHQSDPTECRRIISRQVDRRERDPQNGAAVKEQAWRYWCDNEFRLKAESPDKKWQDVAMDMVDDIFRNNYQTKHNNKEFDVGELIKQKIDDHKSVQPRHKKGVCRKVSGFWMQSKDDIMKRAVNRGKGEKAGLEWLINDYVNRYYLPSIKGDPKEDARQAHITPEEIARNMHQARQEPRLPGVQASKTDQRVRDSDQELGHQSRHNPHLQDHEKSPTNIQSTRTPLTRGKPRGENGATNDSEPTNLERNDKGNGAFDAKGFINKRIADNTSVRAGYKQKTCEGIYADWIKNKDLILTQRAYFEGSEVSEKPALEWLINDYVERTSTSPPEFNHKSNDTEKTLRSRQKEYVQIGQNETHNQPEVKPHDNLSGDQKESPADATAYRKIINSVVGKIKGLDSDEREYLKQEAYNYWMFHDYDLKAKSRGVKLEKILEDMVHDVARRHGLPKNDITITPDHREVQSRNGLSNEGDYTRDVKPETRTRTAKAPPVPRDRTQEVRGDSPMAKDHHTDTVQQTDQNKETQAKPSWVEGVIDQKLETIVSISKDQKITVKEKTIKLWKKGKRELRIKKPNHTDKSLVCGLVDQLVRQALIDKDEEEAELRRKEKVQARKNASQSRERRDNQDNQRDVFKPALEANTQRDQHTNVPETHQTSNSGQDNVQTRGDDSRSGQNDPSSPAISNPSPTMRREINENLNDREERIRQGQSLGDEYNDVSPMGSPAFTTGDRAARNMDRYDKEQKLPGVQPRRGDQRSRNDKPELGHSSRTGRDNDVGSPEASPSYVTKREVKINMDQYPQEPRLPGVQPQNGAEDRDGIDEADKSPTHIPNGKIRRNYQHIAAGTSDGLVMNNGRGPNAQKANENYDENYPATEGEIKRPKPKRGVSFAPGTAPPQENGHFAEQQIMDNRQDKQYNIGDHGEEQEREVTDEDSPDAIDGFMPAQNPTDWMGRAAGKAPKPPQRNPNENHETLETPTEVVKRRETAPGRKPRPYLTNPDEKSGTAETATEKIRITEREKDEREFGHRSRTGGGGDNVSPVLDDDDFEVEPTRTTRSPIRTEDSRGEKIRRPREGGVGFATRDQEHAPGEKVNNRQGRFGHNSRRENNDIEELSEVDDNTTRRPKKERPVGFATNDQDIDEGTRTKVPFGHNNRKDRNGDNVRIDDDDDFEDTRETQTGRRDPQVKERKPEGKERPLSGQGEKRDKGRNEFGHRRNGISQDEEEYATEEDRRGRRDNSTRGDRRDGTGRRERAERTDRTDRRGDFEDSSDNSSDLDSPDDYRNGNGQNRVEIEEKNFGYEQEGEKLRKQRELRERQNNNQEYSDSDEEDDAMIAKQLREKREKDRQNKIKAEEEAAKDQQRAKEARDKEDQKMRDRQDVPVDTDKARRAWEKAEEDDAKDRQKAKEAREKEEQKMRARQDASVESETRKQEKKDQNSNDNNNNGEDQGSRNYNTGSISIKPKRLFEAGWSIVKFAPIYLTLTSIVIFIWITGSRQLTSAILISNGSISALSPISSTSLSKRGSASSSSIDELGLDLSITGNWFSNIFDLSGIQTPTIFVLLSVWNLICIPICGILIHITLNKASNPNRSKERSGSKSRIFGRIQRILNASLRVIIFDKHFSKSTNENSTTFSRIKSFIKKISFYTIIRFSIFLCQLIGTILIFRQIMSLQYLNSTGSTSTFSTSFDVLFSEKSLIEFSENLSSGQVFSITNFIFMILLINLATSWYIYLNSSKKTINNSRSILKWISIGLIITSFTICLLYFKEIANYLVESQNSIKSKASQSNGSIVLISANIMFFILIPAMSFVVYELDKIRIRKFPNGFFKFGKRSESKGENN